MAERCELCGARWEVGASTCRDCGSERRVTVPPGESSASMSGAAVPREAQVSAPAASDPAPSASPSSEAPTVPIVPIVPIVRPAVPIHVPPGVSQPLSRPPGQRALLLGVVVAGLAVAIGLTAWLATPSAAPEAKPESPIAVRAGERSACEELAAMAGTWVFTTATTGARRKERLGVRGFYQLQVTVDGCTATAGIAKTGRTDRKAFDDHKIPRAEATLVPGEGVEAYGFAGTFVLRNEDGQGVDTRFVLAREGERLVGHWRQLGERWHSSGLYGVLEGRREGDPMAILPERSTQPCTVRCATPDDITLIDAPDSATHAACLASCE